MFFLKRWKEEAPRLRVRIDSTDMTVHAQRSNSSEVVIAGVEDFVCISRDQYGVPHIEADSELDAWLGLGFAAASDRMFQMDYDRRRASGRLGEILGKDVLRADMLARRLDLTASSKRDYELLSEGTKAIFEAYTRGVNGSLANREQSSEERILGTVYEQWEPWQSIAIFKVRHVLMGLWQHKLARAILYSKVGREIYEQLEDRPPLGSPLTLPPLARLDELVGTVESDLAEVEKHLGFFSEVEAGSNAWAVCGSLIVDGGSLLCNDSHRALDVPNVYWQAHLKCPNFEVAGATFPGLPGFPHFGRNKDVAWAITHAGADTQDLFIEVFDQSDPELYRSAGGLRRARRRIETIYLRDSAPVDVELWQTENGPIVHGDPLKGTALSLRWTGFHNNSSTFEVLVSMLGSSTVDELNASQIGWVDPVNNLVSVDKNGSIAYLLRGALPVRTSASGRQVPVNGWSYESPWRGIVPFDAMPRAVNPESGFIMTANNAILSGEDPYISMSFADPFRAERLREQLASSKLFTKEDLSKLQRDVTSWAAVAWCKYLSDMEPLESVIGEKSRAFLAQWNGVLSPDSGSALLYGCFRRSLAECIYRPLLGDETWEWAISGKLAPTAVMIRRWLANDTWDILGGPRPNDYDSEKLAASVERVRAVVPVALENAWISAEMMSGPDPSHWRWGDHHYVVPNHPLASMARDQGMDINPPTVQMGGDSDTIQAASYGWRQNEPFVVTNLSVYRQVVDLAGNDYSWVIPGGASGDPTSGHFADQFKLWETHERFAMNFGIRGCDAEEEPLVILVGDGA